MEKKMSEMTERGKDVGVKKGRRYWESTPYNVNWLLGVDIVVLYRVSKTLNNNNSFRGKNKMAAITI